MSTMEPLFHLINKSSSNATLSKEEVFILEAEIFVRICEELKQCFRNQYKDYFRVIKLTTEMEDTMLNIELMRFVINDILSTEEYTLSGLAYYTNTPDEVILDIMLGRNTAPSVIFFRKLIELHRTIRHDLYNAIMKKIISYY